MDCLSLDHVASNELPKGTLSTLLPLSREPDFYWPRSVSVKSVKSLHGSWINYAHLLSFFHCCRRSYSAHLTSSSCSWALLNLLPNLVTSSPSPPVCCFFNLAFQLSCAKPFLSKVVHYSLDEVHLLVYWPGLRCFHDASEADELNEKWCFRTSLAYFNSLFSLPGGLRLPEIRFSWCTGCAEVWRELQNSWLHFSIIWPHSGSAFFSWATDVSWPALMLLESSDGLLSS